MYRSTLSDPLYYAHTADIVTLLLYEKAELNIKGFKGMTPLHRAVLHNDSSAVQALLYAKSDVNARVADWLPRFDRHHHTALWLALKNRAFKNAKTLIQFGAKVKIDKLWRIAESYWHESPAVFFNFANSVVDLGEQIFEILGYRWWLSHVQVQNPECRMYLTKILSLLPSNVIKMDLNKGSTLWQMEPLAIQLAQSGYADLIGPLLSKGINLDVERSSAEPFHIFLNSQ